MDRFWEPCRNTQVFHVINKKSKKSLLLLLIFHISASVHTYMYWDLQPSTSSSLTYTMDSKFLLLNWDKGSDLQSSDKMMLYRFCSVISKSPWYNISLGFRHLWRNLSNRVEQPPTVHLPKYELHQHLAVMNLDQRLVNWWGMTISSNLRREKFTFPRVNEKQARGRAVQTD